MEKIYNELNEYLNNWFIENEDIEIVFVNNFFNMFYICHLVCNSELYSCFENPKDKNHYMDAVTSIKYAREIISSIDKKMLDKFDECINNGIFNLTQKDYDILLEEKGKNEKLSNEELEKNNPGSSYYRYVPGDNEILNEQIEISLSHTTNDIAVIVHEFIHYYLNDINLSDNYVFLIEFFSTYFELYSINYMKQFNDDNLKISMNYLLRKFLWHSKYIQENILVFLAYDNFGNINENSIKDLEEVYGIKTDSFDKICIDLLNTMKKDINVMFNYKYVIATLLTYYSIDKILPTTIIEFGKNINMYKNSNKTLNETLEMLGIDFSFENIEETIEKIKDEFLKENNYINKK